MIKIQILQLFYLWGLWAACTSSAGASAQPSFVELCRSEKLAPKTQRTVATLKSHAQTSDCQMAAQWIGKTTKLWLNSKGLEDISPLVSFTELRELDLTDNLIEDLSPLAELRNLRALWLGENLISDLRPLRSLGQLELLDVEDNRIANLEPLRGLFSLQALDLSRNRVDDLRPLNELPQLSFLFVAHNHIETLPSLQMLSPLALLPKFGRQDWETLFNDAYGQGPYFRLVELDGNPLARPLRRHASANGGNPQATPSLPVLSQIVVAPTSIRR